MSPNAAISIRDLTKSFGRTQALTNVSFDIPAASIFGLLGPNGAGKTTLFSLVAGFIYADQGDIDVLGEKPGALPLAGRFSILPQDAQFARNVPISDQLLHLARLSGWTHGGAPGQVARVLREVGLDEVGNRGAKTLSHGMSKRLGIAQALLTKPDLILLDEPTAGLDPKEARRIRNLMITLRASGSTVVVSSHNLAEIQELCDHMAILARGKVVATGASRDILTGEASLLIELSRPLASSDEKAWLAEAPIASLTREDDLTWRVALKPKEGNDASPDELEALVRQTLRSLIDLGYAPMRSRLGLTLEERFLEMIEQSEAA